MQKKYLQVTTLNSNQKKLYDNIKKNKGKLTKNAFKLLNIEKALNIKKKSRYTIKRNSFGNIKSAEKAFKLLNIENLFVSRNFQVKPKS